MRTAARGSWLILFVPAIAFGGFWYYLRSHPIKPKMSLFEAVARRDVDAIKNHAQTGTDLDVAVGGHTALYRAASNGDTKAVQALLDAGASPNAEMKGKTTPLQAAAQSGSLDCVRALIAKGAVVDTVNASGSTALHSAASGGNPEIVKLFLAQGLKIDAQRKVDHATPLCDAASLGRLECVRTLIEMGANKDLAGFEGRTPLILCTLPRHHETAMELLRLGANPSIADNAKVMPLGYALFVGDTELVNALIPVTKPATWTDRLGRGAIYWAELGNARPETIAALKKMGCTK